MKKKKKVHSVQISQKTYQVLNVLRKKEGRTITGQLDVILTYYMNEDA